MKMSSVNFTEVINTSPIKVRETNPSVTNPFYFGAEKSLFHNTPTNNPNYIGSSYRFKQFGGGCVGKNNVGYFVTRVANGHGISGGNLYWSKTTDEGKTWTPLQLFEGDTVTDASAEDIRDCTICYDALLEKYFLIYAHQYGIVNGDYSRVTSKFKVLVCDDAPFESTWYDISPGIVPLDGNTISGDNNIQTFEVLHRIGFSLYLPCYSWELLENSVPTYTQLLKLDFNDSLPLSSAIQYMSWTTVNKWEYTGDNETTLYVTYQSNGEPRLNMLSRRSDMGYLSYSDDGGTTWSEKESIGIEIAGGPRVFELNSGYMLVAREQKLLSGRMSTVFAMFSQNGTEWGNRMKIGDVGTGYASLLKFESGKTLVIFSEEFSHTGIQVARQMFGSPIF